MFDYQDNCFDHDCFMIMVMMIMIMMMYYRHDANGDDNMKMVPISEKWSAVEGVECLANSSLRHFD